MRNEFWTHPSSFIVSGDSSLHNQSNIKRQFSKRRHVLPPTSKGVNTIFLSAFSLLAIARAGDCCQSIITGQTRSARAT
jgi:hypothetical protein